MSATLSGCLLGLLLGLRHALEPDHLAAVGALVAEERRPRGGMMIGLFWGLGHAAMIFFSGALLCLLHAELPAQLAQAFELFVAMLLILLGARAFHRALHIGRRGPVTHHHHGEKSHRHAGPTDHVHLRGWTLARRPLLIGIVHGLAGSGALTALALTRMPTAIGRLAYLALFGWGSIAGMMLLSGAAGFAAARLAKSDRVARLLLGSAGALSAALGVLWGCPHLIALLGR